MRVSWTELRYRMHHPALSPGVLPTMPCPPHPHRHTHQHHHLNLPPQEYRASEGKQPPEGARGQLHAVWHHSVTDADIRSIQSGEHLYATLLKESQLTCCLRCKGRACPVPCSEAALLLNVLPQPFLHHSCAPLPGIIHAFCKAAHEACRNALCTPCCWCCCTRRPLPSVGHPWAARPGG